MSHIVNTAWRKEQLLPLFMILFSGNGWRNNTTECIQMSFLPSGGPCVNWELQMWTTTDDLSPRQLTTYWQLYKVCHYHTNCKMCAKVWVFLVLSPPHSCFGIVSIRGVFDLKGWNIHLKDIFTFTVLRWYGKFFHFNSSSVYSSSTCHIGSTCLLQL